MEQLLLEPQANEPDDAITLGLYAERAYLDYAVSVVKGRALPDVCDGQKPVQRRILYAMSEMALGANAKPMKSARVVGDVLGKFHPHGDQAAYEALVRMAQSFTLRYPLIDGQGNFGSRDGDGAAAMRYTEARLTPISKLLLDEIDMGTVDFMPNYDGTMQEPKQLPARLPFVLLNGASGIAVGMATEIPSHNLREEAQAAIAYIQKPNTTLDDILQLLPGPDFAGGAQIISLAATLKDIYDSGRGSIKVRAKWTIEELARGQWQLVVNELPPNASAARVLEEIEELTNPKVKAGKKGLSADQQNLKQTILAVLDSVRDESGREASVRLVFEPKSRNVSPDEFANMLLAHTSLETNVSINLVAVARDGRPGQRGLLAILPDWIAFRAHTIRRRTQHRLAQVDDRLHVLAGRLIAWLNIDEVIRTIRESDEPKSALMQAFKLSERQADDILEVRLRQLARLEKIKIEQEIAALTDEKADLESLLADENKLRRRMVSEIKKDADTYGDDRRTLIEVADRAQIEVKIVDEPVTVIVSQKFWIKARQGHGHDASQFTFKPGDALYAAFECRTADSIAVFGSGSARERVFSVPVSVLPSARGDGLPLPSLIELPPGGGIAHVLGASPQQPIILAGSHGYAFGSRQADLATRQKAGKSYLTLAESDQLLPPVLVTRTDEYIAVLTSSGRFHAFALTEMKYLAGGGRGVQCIPLEDGEILLSLIAFGPQDRIELQGVGRGDKLQTAVLKPAELKERIGKRGRKGRELSVKFRPSTLKKLLTD